MATFRCPKHDNLFQAEKAPTQHGHAKCPFCNPNAQQSKPVQEDTFGQPENKPAAHAGTDPHALPST